MSKYSPPLTTVMERCWLVKKSKIIANYSSWKLPTGTKVHETAARKKSIRIQ